VTLEDVGVDILNTPVVSIKETDMAFNAFKLMKEMVLDSDAGKCKSM
jgi:hypothetical protein